VWEALKGQGEDTPPPPLDEPRGGRPRRDAVAARARSLLSSDHGRFVAEGEHALEGTGGPRNEGAGASLLDNT